MPNPFQTIDDEMLKRKPYDPKDGDRIISSIQNANRISMGTHVAMLVSKHLGIEMDKIFVIDETKYDHIPIQEGKNKGFFFEKPCLYFQFSISVDGKINPQTGIQENIAFKLRHSKNTTLSWYKSCFDKSPSIKMKVVDEETLSVFFKEIEKILIAQKLVEEEKRNLKAEVYARAKKFLGYIAKKDGVEKAYILQDQEVCFYHGECKRRIGVVFHNGLEKISMEISDLTESQIEKIIDLLNEAERNTI